MGRPHIGMDPANGVNTDHRTHSRLMECMEIGAIVHLMRRNTVGISVA